MTDKQCCNFSVVINIITIRSFYINYFVTIGESGEVAPRGTRSGNHR
jgi:hypothetical protein